MTFGKLLYPPARAALFRLEPERAHDLALGALRRAKSLGSIGMLSAKVPDRPIQCMGLEFANPCGLAAGLDKNGDYFEALGALGFGFIEIGTVTPKPQAGNPKPRMFRLVEHQALINRLGFNNKGVDHLCRQVKRRRYRGVLGINIGKNKDTPNAQAIDDYVHCLRKVYPLADYVTINISSPNTKGLRDLQRAESLAALVEDVLNEQSQLEAQHQKVVPLLIKLAPDLDSKSLKATAKVLNETQPNGVIMGNTTIGRDLVTGHPQAEETGGLSGGPLRELASQQLKKLRQHLDPKIPIIGVGGITSGQVAAERFANGAELVQVYTGFIYHGPELIGQVVKHAP